MFGRRFHDRTRYQRNLPEQMHWHANRLMKLAFTVDAFANLYAVVGQMQMLLRKLFEIAQLEHVITIGL